MQYVSGWMFDTFGLRPALGRLLTEDDDLKPGAHPYAVLSYDYWTRRFARQIRRSSGRTLPHGRRCFSRSSASAAEPFTGTETGTVTDIFLPIDDASRTLASSNNWTWHRTLAQFKPGVAARSRSRKTARHLSRASKERAPRASRA